MTSIEKLSGNCCNRCITECGYRVKLAAHFYLGTCERCGQESPITKREFCDLEESLRKKKSACCGSPVESEECPCWSAGCMGPNQRCTKCGRTCYLHKEGEKLTNHTLLTEELPKDIIRRIAQSPDKAVEVMLRQQNELQTLRRLLAGARKSLERIPARGFNEQCIFCAFKDREANKALSAIPKL